MTKIYTINEVALILGDVITGTLKVITGQEIRLAPTILEIQNVSLRPDISSFLDFFGDYNGLICLNFSKEAGLELCRSHYLIMGLSEEAFPNDPFSEEVINFVGEMTNQIAGNFRRRMEEKFGLTSKNHQPKALQLTHTIQMFIESALKNSQCRKLSFSTASHQAFYAELSLEKIKFILTNPKKLPEPKEETAKDLLDKYF